MKFRPRSSPYSRGLRDHGREVAKSTKDRGCPFQRRINRSSLAGRLAAERRRANSSRGESRPRRSAPEGEAWTPRSTVAHRGAWGPAGPLGRTRPTARFPELAPYSAATHGSLRSAHFCRVRAPPHSKKFPRFPHLLLSAVRASQKDGRLFDWYHALLPGEDGEDREVPPAYRGAAVAAPEQPGHVGGSDRFRQRVRPTRHRRCRHGWSERGVRQTFNEQEAQQRAQP
jgi:hypothetical protein